MFDWVLSAPLQSITGGRVKSLVKIFSRTHRKSSTIEFFFSKLTGFKATLMHSFIGKVSNCRPAKYDLRRAHSENLR